MEAVNATAIPNDNLVDLTTDNATERLIAAVKDRDAEEVQRLLENRGADPNERDESGWSSLHYAAYEGDPVCTQLLLQSGADIFASIPSNGKSVLHIACCARTGTQKADFIEFLLERGARVNAADNQGWTPLHCAVDCWTSRRSVELLLEKGADAEAETQEGKTPLHIAVVGASASGSEYGATQQLLNAGATNNVRDNSGKKPSDYASPLLKDILEGRAAFDGDMSSPPRGNTATNAPASPTNPTAAPAAALDGTTSPGRTGTNTTPVTPTAASGNSLAARLDRLEEFLFNTISQGSIRARVIKLEANVMGRNNTGGISRRLEMLEETAGVLNQG